MSDAMIAIVGMACRYPDARSPHELWQSVLAQRRAFRRIPRERLDMADYLSSDPTDLDSIYIDQAALIEGWEFDRARFRIAGSTFRQVDLAHWLALEVATESLADAGFQEGEGLPRETTGVLVGNTLTGEFSRANTMRLRWPYVRRMTDAALRERGMGVEERRAFLAGLETRFKAPFPVMGEESLAGGLSNTIAGRVCNYFDLKGGGYTVDGACASSLLAVANACTLLTAGDLDVAIAGGVDLSLDPFELVGFARTGALAPELMRVYDQGSAGFWPGEGCGFVVLMREAEARARGLRTYAVVRGWGVASDGSGGITRPEPEGQLLAVRRAYRRAGFDIGTVGYLEGHGTGTQVGDAVELQVLSRARRETPGAATPVTVGSVKANIGHTKAAAGVAGLIKATLALHHQIVPPTSGCFEPHATLTAADRALKVAREGTLWPEDRPLRAGVSAMGFGGIDAHVVLESAPVARRAAFTSEEAALLDTPQDAELFLLGAPDLEGLRRQIESLSAIAGRVSIAELTDLAAALSPPANSAVRAAVVAGRPADLERGLAALAARLDHGGEPVLDAAAGVFVGRALATPARIGFLFPGQGSPSHLDGGAWRRRFRFARARWDALPRGADPRDTRIAQPAIVAASLAALQVLREAGVEAVAGVGHSLGELTALCWASAFDDEAVLRIATARGRAMSDLGHADGAMASLATDAATAATLIEGTGAVLSGLNAPRQTVVSGHAGAVAAVIERARARGVAGVRLPVSHAFHSPLVAAAAQALAAQLERETFAPLAGQVYSTIAGRVLGRDDDVRELLLQQVVSPVRFTEAFALAGPHVDLWIEVGPGAVLSGLAHVQSQAPAIAVDAGGSSFAGLLRAIGAAWALGAPVRSAALFEGRFTRVFDLDWRPRFLANPCESAPRADDLDDSSEAPESASAGPPRGANGAKESARPAGGRDVRRPARPEPPARAATERDAAPTHSGVPDRGAASAPAGGASTLELVRALVAERVELPVSAVGDGDGLLRDLHLNSIVVGQIAAEAARRMGLAPPADPTAMAGATVAELALALEESHSTHAADPGGAPEGVAEGLDLWVRAFEVREIACPRRERPLPVGESRWRVFAPPGDPLAAALAAELESGAGRGVVVCLPADADERCAGLLLEAAHAVWPERQASTFVLVERDGGGGGAFARTLHLESPATAVCVVGVPDLDPRAAAWVRAEALGATGYTEAHYGRDGVRREPRLRALDVRTPAASSVIDPSAKAAEASSNGAPPLTTSDVLLVTGGGKGIAAECALDLARWTGAKLAIVGRALPEDDPALAGNLARMATAGATHRYVAADVTDADAMRAAVRVFESELGPITAVLHGAGMNEPRPLAALDDAAFQSTLGPKLVGLRHVLGALDASRLVLLVGFGSIIARIGVPGEADYAVANEWHTRAIERFQREHPACRCLSVEWSVWSGVGMGERLGRIDRLARAGVTAITPEIGVRMLRGLLSRPASPVAVVVTGRFGDPPTLAIEGRALPLLRFLERVRVHVPGVELVADAELTLASDPYLEDHAWNGARLLPGVMGLEAMAQAACAVAGNDRTPAFEDVRFDRPVVLDEEGRREIRLLALAREPGLIDVALRSAETGFQVDHFRARCRFTPSAESNGKTSGDARTPAEAPPPGNGAAPDGDPIVFDAERELYGRVLFQSGRFQRVRAYRRLRGTESVADIAPSTVASWFGPWIPSASILGDPGARDAALHSIQASIPHRTLLPVAVERIETMVLAPGDAFVARARQRHGDGKRYVYDLEIASASGAVLERWIGLELRAAGPTRYQGPWPSALLGAFLERRFVECVPGEGLTAVLQRNGGAEAAMHHALGTDRTLVRRPDGKPEVTGDPAMHVSAAHAGILTLAVSGRVAVGCDLERVARRSPEDWLSLLGESRTELARAIAIACREDHDAACTRVWTVIECLKKSGVPAGAPVRVASRDDGGWLELESGGMRIATFVAPMDDGDRLAIGMLAGTPDARV